MSNITRAGYRGRHPPQSGRARASGRPGRARAPQSRRKKMKENGKKGEKRKEIGEKEERKKRGGKKRRERKKRIEKKQGP